MQNETNVVDVAGGELLEGPEFDMEPDEAWDLETSDEDLEKGGGFDLTSDLMGDADSQKKTFDAGWERFCATFAAPYSSWRAAERDLIRIWAGETALTPEFGAISLTRLEAKSGKFLSKKFERKADGSLQKIAGATFGSGKYRKLNVGSLEEFAWALDDATPSQAFMYSVCNTGTEGQMTTRAFLPEDHEQKGIAARIKEMFEHPEGPAIVALDYDPPIGGEVLDRDGLFHALTHAVPALKKTAMLWTTSASSCIADAQTGEILRGIAGQRIYLVIQSGSDLTRFIDTLFMRLWLRGYGRIELSKSGAMLERSIIDLALRNPVQPDFVGGAVCGDGLIQNRPDPVFLSMGDPLDTEAYVEDLTEQELSEYNLALTAKKASLEAEAQRVRAEWREQRKKEWLAFVLKDEKIARTNVARLKEINRRITEALDTAASSALLLGDFRVKLHDGRYVPVSEIAGNRDMYDGIITFDPEEPEYDGGRLVGKVMFSGRKVILYSMAHGGRVYKLEKKVTSIEYRSGESSDCVNATLEYLRSAGEMYSSGACLVKVTSDGRLNAPTPATLAHYLGESVRYFTEIASADAEKEPERKKIDPPAGVCRTILELGEDRNLMPIEGIVTMPLMLPNGDFRDVHGYDSETKLFIHIKDSEWDGIPEKPTNAELRSALAKLWFPYSEFPWETDVDRGVALACLLTAITRVGLPTAPGFAFDAAMQSSGKTKAACVASALVSGFGGEGLVPFPGAVKDEEMSKMLLAIMMAGKRVFLMDNVIGNFESASIASAMTGGYIEGRVLGESRMSGRMPVRTLMMVTGNNISLGGDTSQRYCVARLRPNTARPESRKFDFDPVKYAEKNRHELVIAGLTLLRGFVAAGMQRSGEGCSRFEEWDRLIRQSVLWIANELGEDFGDPISSMTAQQQLTPEEQELCSLLAGWEQVFGSAEVSSNSLIEKVAGWDHAMTGLSLGQREILEVVREWGRNGQLPTVKSLGKCLANRRGRYAKDGSNRRLERIERGQGAVFWVVLNT